MVRVSPPTRSGASGELSELMYGRPDFARYQSAWRRLRGFIAMPEGPVARLPGTQMIGRVKDDAPSRLMPFIFRDEDAVLLEWGDGTLRFWRDDVLVEAGGTPYEITTLYNSTAVGRLQSLQSADRIYLTEGSLPPQRLSRHAIDNWSVENTPFVGGPFAPRNLDENKTIQVSDITGSITLTASEPVFDPAHVGVQFELRETDTSDTPAWSADKATSVGQLFLYSGRVYRVFSGSNTGVNPPVHTEGKWRAEKDGVVWEFVHDGIGIVRITDVADAQNATAEVEKPLPNGLATNPTYRWSEAAWSDIRGWPRAIGAHQSRHMYAGSQVEPRTIWKSVIGGTVDMTAGANDDDGFSYALRPAKNRLGEIRWIADGGDAVHIGTSADEFVGRSIDANRAFSRETAKYSSDTSVGVADIEPVVINGDPVFVQKTGRRLILQMIDPATGRFRGDNLTQIARHILGPGVERLVYQEDPVQTVWAALENGDLAGCTYVPTQKTIGFHSHSLAGGKVEDIAVMPSADGKSEYLYLLVARDFDGQTHRFIEKMMHPFVDLDGLPRLVTEAWHQFCAISYEGELTAVIAGLDHLEGATVTAWTDQGGFADLTVSGGAITLPVEVTKAIVGLDATDSQKASTLDVVTNTPDGGDEGRLRTHRVSGVRVHRSAGGTFSVEGQTDGDAWSSEPQSIFDLSEFELPELKDGVFELAGHKGWESQTWLTFRPEPGAPLTITSRTPTIMVTDS